MRWHAPVGQVNCFGYAASIYLDALLALPSQARLLCPTLSLLVTCSNGPKHPVLKGKYVNFYKNKKLCDAT